MAREIGSSASPPSGDEGGPMSSIGLEAVLSIILPAIAGKIELLNAARNQHRVESRKGGVHDGETRSLEWSEYQMIIGELGRGACP